MKPTTLPRLMINTEKGPLIVVHGHSFYHSQPGADVPFKLATLRENLLKNVWGHHRKVSWFDVHTPTESKH